VANVVISNIAATKSLRPRKHKKMPPTMKKTPQSQSNLLRKIHMALVLKLGQTSDEPNLTTN